MADLDVFVVSINRKLRNLLWGPGIQETFDGFIVRELSRIPSNFRSVDTIQHFLEKHGFPLRVIRREWPCLPWKLWFAWLQIYDKYMKRMHKSTTIDGRNFVSVNKSRNLKIFVVMEFYEVLERRRTIRDFSDKIVTDEVLEKILSAYPPCPTRYYR